MVGAPFVRMGTRALAGGWLVGGADAAGMLEEKRRVLAGHHDEAVAALPGTDSAALEVLELVRRAVEPGCGEPGPGERHPIDAAGRLVAEDLCLLVPGQAGGWVLGAASLCFPSHWRLRDKLGRSVAGIHGPVPGYADELEVRVDRFLDRLRAGAPVWRRNWTVHASATLFAPEVPPPPDPPITVDDAAERLWVRSEYQTLQRLPETGAILFGIRTQQVPLGELAGRRDLCARLADAASAWDGPFLDYRGGDPIRSPLVAWLRRAG